MNKYLKITIISIFVLTLFLSGCTQNNSNNDDVDDQNNLEVFDVRVDVDPNNNFFEVLGKIKNNEGRDLDKVDVVVIFFDKDGVKIHSAAYSIYNFLTNYTENFFVRYSYLDPNYEKYDSYIIETRIE